MLIVQLLHYDLFLQSKSLTAVERQEAKHHAMQHQAQGPDVDLGSRMHLPLEELRSHIPQAPTVYVLHPNPGNGTENSKVHYFQLHVLELYLSFLVVSRWLGQHHILELHIPVDNLAVMAVVDGTEQLIEQVVGLPLSELSIRLCFPELIQFSAFKVLHHDDELLLLRQREGVMELDDILVLQLPQGLDLLRDHVGVLVRLEIQNLNCYFLLEELVVSQVYRAKPTFAQLLLHLDEFHPDLVIEWFACQNNTNEITSQLTEGVEQVLVPMYRLHVVAVHELKAAPEAEEVDLLDLRVAGETLATDDAVVLLDDAQLD